MIITLAPIALTFCTMRRPLCFVVLVEAEDFMQLGDEGLFIALQDLHRNAVFVGCFARGMRAQGLEEFFEGWFSMELL